MLSCRFFFLLILLLTSCWVGADNEKVIRILYVSKEYSMPIPLSLLAKEIKDAGIQGARFSSRDSNQAGKLLGYRYELQELLLNKDQAVSRIETYLQQGYRFIVSDLEADDLLTLADLAAAKQALVLNIRSESDRLRFNQCRANVFHIVPSKVMRADALAQYLIWKKWPRWLLLRGKKAEDKAFADAIKRSAKRFGGKIVDQRSYRLETGNRRVETGHQQIQAQMPMLTRGAPEHDVVIVADENESFGLYLPYRTARPRPVAGSYGLVSVSWHRSYEQYGAARMQKGFEKFAGRSMTERDYLAWLSIKLLAKALSRAGSSDMQILKEYLLSEELDLAGYKGRPMSFRLWNQQLRQPILLSADSVLVSMAPLDGFLHPHFYTDTLGYDVSDSNCNLNK